MTILYNEMASNSTLFEFKGGKVTEKDCPKDMQNRLKITLMVSIRVFNVGSL